jgi:hypothetical protein
MQEPQKIEVRIAPNGTVTIHVQGVKGEGCALLTLGLEQALGGLVTDRQFTEEYYEQAEETVHA